MIGSWNGRVVLVGELADPANWFMDAADPADFTYPDDDVKPDHIVGEE